MFNYHVTSLQATDFYVQNLPLPPEDESTIHMHAGYLPVGSKTDEEREKLFRTDVALTEFDGSSTSVTTTQPPSIITIPRSSSFSTSTSQSFTATATNSPISIFTSESSTDC
ncbi:unnamed protein product, partial [Adineta steineri]